VSIHRPTGWLVQFWTFEFHGSLEVHVLVSRSRFGLSVLSGVVLAGLPLELILEQVAFGVQILHLFSGVFEAVPFPEYLVLVVSKRFHS